MQYKADVQNPGDIWQLLTPELLDSLAAQIVDLTQDDLEALNNLEQTLPRSE
jgi:hypothetical protein